jgi:hypothetical protein
MACAGRAVGISTPWRSRRVALDSRSFSAPILVVASAPSLCDFAPATERDGVTHVIDIVGREHYPTVASFIDEARRLGISRRAPRTIDFGRITRASRLLLAHGHADIANAPEFPCDERCPCHVAEHLAPGFGDMCARLWWTEPLEAARHRLGLFASFPIPQIEVVRDDTGGSHLSTIAQASQAGVPVVEVER